MNEINLVSSDASSNGSRKKQNVNDDTNLARYCSP